MSGVNTNLEASLTGRQRSRLRLAREYGHLNAICRDRENLLSAYARWCWRMRLPLVWSERRFPHSRYCQVHLDLYTTVNRLTPEGQAAMQSLAPRPTISPHDARWDRVLRRDVDRLAAAVFRASIRPANYRMNGVDSPAGPAHQPKKLLVIEKIEKPDGVQRLMDRIRSKVKIG